MPAVRVEGSVGAGDSVTASPVIDLGRREVQVVVEVRWEISQ
jgi:hypothetical protein